MARLRRVSSSARTAKGTTRQSISSVSIGTSELLKKLQASNGVLTIPDFFSTYVPRYESVNYGRFIQTIAWDRRYAARIAAISPKRTNNRIGNYLIRDELDRVAAKLKTKREASIRFGVAKSGHGYDGERGDFCLVGGAIKGRDLTVFYRSIELIGGFAYDLCLFNELGVRLGIDWKTVTILSCKAFIFALRGNSNEKLYPKLREILNGK